MKMSVMKYVLVILITYANLCQAQIAYLVDDANAIYELDMITCTSQHIFTFDLEDTLQDLAINAVGQLYGITERGNLYNLDPENGVSVLVHSFLFLQSFNALWQNDQGLIFTTGSEGFLYTYSPQTNEERFLGDIGFTTTGDLIYRAGQLYASSDEREVILIDPSTLQQCGDYEYP